MSDVMFYGVLRMPFDLAMADYMSQWQFYQRAQEAADRLEKAEAAKATGTAGELPVMPEPFGVIGEYADEERDVWDYDQMHEYGQACAEAARQPAPVVAVPDELRSIGELLRTQDNRYTDQPLFIVQQKRLIVGIDPNYLDEDQIGWFDADGKATPEEHAVLESNWQITQKRPDGWTRTGFSEQWEFVTACFTEQGCKDYLAKDGHNLKEPRIYAEGSYRNEEFRAVRNWLMSLEAATNRSQP